MGKSGSKLLAVEPTFDLSRLDEIPDDIRATIERQISLQSDQIDELKSSYERLRVDSEQKCFELEKQLRVSNEKLQQETKSSTTLRQQVLDLEKNYSEASQKLRETQDELFDATRFLEEVKRDNVKVEAEKVELVEVLEKKNIEVNTLTEEWKTFSVKLNEANQQRIEALAKVDEVETKSVTEQYQMSRLQQEMDHLRQQNEWLDGELREKTDALLTLRKEKSSSVLELQAQLDEKTQEMAYLEETVQLLKKTSEESNVKIENYIQKLKESRELHTQIQEQYTHEVASQEKLLALYKEGASENEAKVSELTTAVVELQKHLKQASEAYSEIAAQRDKELEEAGKVEQAKDEQIAKLRKELKDANDLLEAARKKGVVPLSDEGIEALSPSAAAASRLLKSGMTLTQIYSEYVEVCERLQSEKAENDRLNQYLEQILEEIEEKAPIMKAQREDYEHALQAVTQLTQQLDSAMLETEKLRVSTEDDSRRCREMTRANHRLQQQVVDLSQQVRVLLKELEEARGRRVPLDTSRDDQNVTCSEISSSSVVITDKLVTFRSIEELQEQNQRLLEVVRKLSEKLEERDTAVRDERTSELQARLDEAQSELEQMRESRERQAEMVEAIIRQRDMFRVLLSQTDLSMPQTPGGRASQPKTSTPQSSADSPVVSGARSEDAVDTKRQLTDMKNALKELQEQFNTYKRDKADNDRIVNEQLEKFRQEASDLRVQNARLAAQLDFASERHKTLVSNIDVYKKEIAVLQDKTRRYSASVMKHEQTVSTQREDLLALQEKLSRAEVRCGSLEAHNAVLKNAEARLVQDKENILREKCSQNLLLANLQAIQNNLERAEFETKTKLTRHIESLRQENVQLQRKIDATISKNQTTVTILENRLGKAHTQLEKRTAEAEGAKREIEDLQQQAEQLKTQLAEATAMAKASQSEPSTDTVKASVQQTSATGASPALEEEIKDLKTQLSQSATEIKALRDHLQQARQHVEQYKAIASSLEQTLATQNQANETLKERLQKTVEEETAERERLQERVDQLEKDNQKLLADNYSVNEQSHTKNAELQTRLLALQPELEEAIKRREAAIGNEQAARRDSEEQAKLAREAQEKYERELMLHAEAVNSLSTVKQELEGFNVRLTEANESAKIAKKTLEDARLAWVTQEQNLKEENTKLRASRQELQRQNQILHEEMEQLSSQMVRLQEVQANQEKESAELAETVAANPGDQSSENLLEVIRFLRREKEIAEARFEVAQAESTRLRQQFEHMQKQLDETTKALMEEREKIEVNLQTAAQHAELMRRVETLNLLQDSNKLMREEKQRMAQQLRDLEVKCQRLESEIGPLEAIKRDLTAQQDAAKAENSLLQAELGRWKARTNQLIEQCSKTDPEEFKRTVLEREQLRKQLASLNEEITKVKQEKEQVRKQLVTSGEENHKFRAHISGLNSSMNTLRAENAKLNSSITTAQNELTASKQHVQKLTAEKATIQATLDAKLKDEEEKLKMTAQLRKIGRKYKMQVEDLQKQLAVVQQKLSSSEEERNKQQQQTAEADPVAMAALQEKLKGREAELALISEKLGSAECERNETTKTVKEMETKVKSLDEEVKKQKEVEVKSRTIMKNVKMKLTSQKAEIEKLKAENRELVKKMSTGDSTSAETKAGDDEEKVVLQAELIALRANIEKLETEKQELTLRITQLEQGSGTGKPRNWKCETCDKVYIFKAGLANHYKSNPTHGKLDNEPGESHEQVDVLQSRSSELEQQVEQEAAGDTLQAELNSLKSENEELRARTQQLVKELESSQKPAQTAAKKPTERTGPGPVETPRRANIRPIPTPGGSGTRHLQTTPTRSISAETRATASIRPMTVAPVTAVQTPTATVMPTSVNIHDAESATTQLPAAQGRPMQQVQPVSPQVSPQSPPAHTTEDLAEEPRTRLWGSHEVSHVETEETAPSTSEAPTTAPSTSDAPTTAPAPKRPREEPETLNEEDTDLPSKKAKTETIEEEDTAALTSDTVTDQTMQEPDLLPEAAEETAEAEEVSESRQTTSPTSLAELQPVAIPDVGGETEQRGTPMQGKSFSVIQMTENDMEREDLAPEEADEDVILVDDVMEETEPLLVREMGEEQEQQEEEEEDEEGFTSTHPEQVDSSEEEEEGESEEGEDEDNEEEESDSGDDNAVVIVDTDDEEENEGEDNEYSREAATVPQAPVRLQPAESAPALNRGQQGQGLHVSEPSSHSIMARMPGLTAGRSHLTPFILGEGGSFEAGDDGIVPSTPTLPVPRRSDGFAEAVSSPQVSRQFVFCGGSDGLAQLEEQRGMDDTNFDLSQTLTCPSGNRSVPTTPVPIISVTEASPPSAEEQDTESGRVTPQLDTTGTESRQTSASQSQSAAGQEVTQESQQAEDICQGGEGFGETTAADDGGSDSNTSAMSRRKIQPIVWSEPGPSTIPSLMAPGPSPQMTPQPNLPVRKLKQQRAVRGQLGVYRGRGTPRGVPPQAAGMAQPRAPLYPQQPIQTVHTPRGRGTRGARGSRGNRAFRQRRPQPF